MRGEEEADCNCIQDWRTCREMQRSKKDAVTIIKSGGVVRIERGRMRQTVTVFKTGRLVGRGRRLSRRQAVTVFKTGVSGTGTG